MLHSIGKAMMVSLLDRVEKNPWSRLGSEEAKSMEMIRKTLAFEVLNGEERFKMLDVKAYHKAKWISKYSGGVFLDKINRRWRMMGLEEELKGVVGVERGVGGFGGWGRREGKEKEK